MFDQPLVVFARRAPTRVGLLLSKPGKSLDVRWEDGATETVTSGDYLWARLGDSRFIQNVLPDLWQQLWSDDESATAVLTLMLAEQSSPTEWPVLRKKAADLLPRGLIDQKRWDRLRNRLRKRLTQEPGAAKLRLGPADEIPVLLPVDWHARWGWIVEVADSPHPEVTAPDAVDSDEASVVSVVPHEASDAPPVDSPGPSHVTTDRASKVEVAGEQEPSQVSEPAPEVARVRDIDTTAAEQPRSASDILHELKKQVRSDPPAGLLRELRSTDVSVLDAFAAEIVYGNRVVDDLAERLFKDPVEQLGALTVPVQSLRGSLENLDAVDRRRASSSLLLARDVLSRELLAGWCSGDDTVDLLNVVAQRVRGIPTKERPQALRQFARVVDALVAELDAHPAASDADSAGAVLRSAPTLTLLVDGGTACVRSAESLVGSIAAAIRGRGQTAATMTPFMAPLSRLPLTPDGARFKFLAALPANETATASARWLDGISADDLVALSDADASRLTRVAAWRKQIAQISERAIAKASTRGRLLRLLAAGAVAPFISTETAVIAIRRVAGGDSTLSGWVRALSNADQISQMSDEVARLEAALLSAADETGSQRSRAREAEDRAHELQIHLDSASAAQSTAHDAVIVQAQRDAYRALARVIAAAGTEARQLDADQLTARLQQLVRIQGIEPIGRVGDHVPFDPSLHDAPGGRPDAGAPVRVGRPGYKWMREHTEEVLVKALVAAEQ